MNEMKDSIPLEGSKYEYYSTAAGYGSPLSAGMGFVWRGANMIISRFASSILLFAGIAAGPGAHAGIIYSGDQSVVVSRSDYRVDSTAVYPHSDALGLDLTGDGQLDFSFFTHAPIPGVPSFVLFGARGLNDGYYSGSVSLMLASYLAGELIGSGPQWTSGDGPIPPSETENWWAPHFFGYLSGEGYLGFKVRTGDAFNFGWIGYSIPAAVGSSLTITGWAFQTDAGVAIAAGDMGTSSVPDQS